MSHSPTKELNDEKSPFLSKINAQIKGKPDGEFKIEIDLGETLKEVFDYKYRNCAS